MVKPRNQILQILPCLPMSQMTERLEKSPVPTTIHNAQKQRSDKLLKTKKRNGNNLKFFNEQMPHFRATKRLKKRNGSMRLWEFILDHLRRHGHEVEGECYVEWVDEKEGTFQIINKTSFSNCWSAYIGRDVSFESMARQLRFVLILLFTF